MSSAKESSRGKFAGMSEAFRSIVQDRRTTLAALDVYGLNLLFNLIHQHQPFGVAALHGIGNMANSGLYTVDWHSMSHIWDYVGFATQGGVYLAAVALGANAVTRVVDHELKRMQGELPIKLKGGIILGDYGGGIPLFSNLGNELKGDKSTLDNVILARVNSETPTRTPDEKGLFRRWSANTGEASEAWYDSKFWKRSGAEDAKIIVLNTFDTDVSIIAADVIRSQVKNKNAQIIVIDSDPEFKHTPNTEPPHMISDKETNSTLINPFYEVAQQVVNGVKQKDTSFFMPHDGEERKEKATSCAFKLTSLPSKPRIFLDGLTDEGEGKGLGNALAFFTNDVTIVHDPENADIVLHFGSEKITDDTETLKGSGNKKIPESALQVGIVYYTDNEDTAMSKHDGTVSIQHAVTSKLKETIEPHIKASTPIWDKIKKLVAKK